MSDESLAQNEAVRNAVLAWYDANARELPWRVGPEARRRGARPDAYRVWLSEIMLQQTTTTHAAPFFHRFTERWPTVQALAGADDEEVMSAWAGLGYYARARNLLGCARAVATAGGAFPGDEDALRRLPGIGAYTAAAIAAIAFDQAAAVVDGNVERVVSRLLALRSVGGEAKAAVRAWALAHRSPRRPGDFAQALMDLGAGICAPRRPRCEICPLSSWCAAFIEGRPDAYPLKGIRTEKPRRFGAAFVMRSEDKVALETRPKRGLLGGMLGLPTTDWGLEGRSRTLLVSLAPEPAAWTETEPIAHVFTHFTLELRVFQAPAATPWAPYQWRRVEEASSCLPTVFRKALASAQGPDRNDDRIHTDS